MSFHNQDLIEDLSGAVVQQNLVDASGNTTQVAAESVSSQYDVGTYSSLALCAGFVGFLGLSSHPDWQIVGSIAAIAGIMSSFAGQESSLSKNNALVREVQVQTGCNAFAPIAPEAAAGDVDDSIRTLACEYQNRYLEQSRRELTCATGKLAGAALFVWGGLRLLHTIMGGDPPPVALAPGLDTLGGLMLAGCIIANNVVSCARLRHVAKRWRDVGEGRRRLISYRPS